MQQPVVIGIGANLCNPEAAVRAAMQAFAAEPGCLFSSLYQTRPEGCAPGAPDFINAVVVFEGAFRLRRHGRDAPARLLAKLLHMESRAGRKRQPGLRNAPRELDLDLILFGQLICRDPGIVLPHPRAAGRLFVLAPLAELLPGLIWPGREQTVSELAALLAGSPDVPVKIDFEPQAKSGS